MPEAPHHLTPEAAQEIASIEAATAAGRRRAAEIRELRALAEARVSGVEHAGSLCNGRDREESR